MGYAVSYLDGDGCGDEAVFGNDDLHHAGFAVQGLLLVEDEVADAVVDSLALKGLDGLQGVGVVADKGVGTGFDQTSGL